MKRKPPSPRRREPSDLEKAEAAGVQYAATQLESDYFMDWVREQLLEAAGMDPGTTLPLETAADAAVIAGNMLKQLEWDTRRDLMAIDIERMIGVSYKTTPDIIDSFYDGFKRSLKNAKSWLADELLQIKGETRDTRIAKGLTDQQTKIDNRMGRAAPRRFGGKVNASRSRVREGRVQRHHATRVVITKVGARTSTAKVYDNNGHLMSGFQSPTDHDYVVKKIEEWFPGVPVEHVEAQPRPKAERSARRRR